MLFSNAYFTAATTAIYDPNCSKSASITTFTMRTLPSWTNTILELNCYNFRFSIKEIGPFITANISETTDFPCIIHMSIICLPTHSVFLTKCHLPGDENYKPQIIIITLYFETLSFQQTQRPITSGLTNLLQRLEFLDF